MKIRDIIIKDLKIIIKDKSVIMLLILMPIILMTILGSALSFSFNDYSDLDRMKIAVVKEYEVEQEKKDLLALIPKDSNIETKDIDLNGFNIEELFFEDFLLNKDIKNILEYEILTKDEATRRLTKKEISAIVILPKGFIKDNIINFGTTFRNEVKIEIIGRANKNIGTTVVEEIIKGFTDAMNYNISAKNTFSRLYIGEGIEGNINNHIKPLMDRISKIMEMDRLDIEHEPLNNRPPMNSKAYYSFSMTAMFILFSAGNGSKFLLEEKDIGTYDRIKVSGVRSWNIVISKAVTIFIITMIQMIITYGYTSILLGANWGAPLNLILIFIAASFAISGLGMMLASIVYKMESYNVANIFTSFIVQIMAILGGSLIPIEQMPEPVKVASNFMPNGLILKAFMKNYYGYGIEDIALYLIILFGMGILFALIAVYILIKEKGGVIYVERSNAKANML